MRKFLLITTLLILASLTAMLSFAQDDDTTTPEPETTEAPETDTLERDAAAWVEIRLTAENPPVYIPADCVSGLTDFTTVTWMQDRGASIATADEARLASGMDDTMMPEAGEQTVTVLCNTPVYDAPGGDIVDGESLQAGQTWTATSYLWLITEQPMEEDMDTDDTMTDPESDFADYGVNAWVEVRVTQETPAIYIPARCVTGLPFYRVVTWRGDRESSIAMAHETGDMGDAEATEEPDAEAEAEAEATAVDLPGEFLVTINCDTAIYSVPGGPIVENENIEAGQTWYVTPFVFLTSDTETDDDITFEATPEVTPEITPEGSGG